MAAGEPDIKQKLIAGHKAGAKTFKVHLDGYNLVPYLTGQVDKSERQGFFYFSDDGDLVALRFDNWKVVFMEQRAQGTLRIWAEPFTPLRVPKLYNLRTDPFERADITSNTYYDWFLDRAYMVGAAQILANRFLVTFKDFRRAKRHRASRLIRRSRKWSRASPAADAGISCNKPQQPRPRDRDYPSPSSVG